MFNSLNRGIEIMKYIAINRSVSVSEIAQKFQIDKSTASRILAILAKHDLISKQESTMKYYASVGALLFSARTRYHEYAHDEIRPLLCSLAERLNLTTQLGVLKFSRVFIIEQARYCENRFIKEPAFPGMDEPFHCTALGKCILAFMPSEECERLLANYLLQEYTTRTITDHNVLLEELAEIRKNQIARDIGEFSPKTFCLAIPIHDNDGNYSFALGVSDNQNFHENERRLQLILTEIRKCADQIDMKYSAKDII